MPEQQKSNKRERANRDAIVYPLRGIRYLLIAHKRGETELNLATAYRQLEWTRSTMEHLWPRLGMFQPEVQKLFDEVEDEVDSFNFAQAKYTEDSYTKAYRMYEDLQTARCGKCNFVTGVLGQDYPEPEWCGVCGHRLPANKE